MHKVYPTKGSSPVLVTCDDLNEWVCKYYPVMTMFNEFIAAKFLFHWGIPTPEQAFVNIAADHIPDSFLGQRIQRNYFEKPCFGSKHLPYAKEVDEFFKTFNQSRYDLTKINDREVFLKIGLFDIWMSNEDRNHNNYNLLINPESDGQFVFYAIDHVNCFNTGNLHRPLYIITKDESILTSDIMKVLFSKGKRLNGIIDKLVEDFYVCADSCRDDVDRILSDLPDSWGIDNQEIRLDIEQIFVEDWLQQTANTFRQYVQIGVQ